MHRGIGLQDEFEREVGLFEQRHQHEMHHVMQHDGGGGGRRTAGKQAYRWTTTTMHAAGESMSQQSARARAVVSRQVKDQYHEWVSACKKSVGGRDWRQEAASDDSCLCAISCATGQVGDPDPPFAPSAGASVAPAPGGRKQQQQDGSRMVIECSSTLAIR